MKIRFVDVAKVGLVKSSLVEQGYIVYELNTRGVQDTVEFFKAALEGLPMGDASECNGGADWLMPENWNWNAFEDFLFEGLIQQETQVAFVWFGSFDLKKRLPDVYSTALEMFEAACEDGYGRKRSSWSLTVYMVEE